VVVDLPAHLLRHAYAARFRFAGTAALRSRVPKLTRSESERGRRAQCCFSGSLGSLAMMLQRAPGVRVLAVLPDCRKFVTQLSQLGVIRVVATW
jgi:hypothetical protein